MPALKITPSKFGIVVSAYAFSAGISGFLAAGFVDRFDRKTILIFFYTGFIIGTLFCGIAPNFEFLLFARIITGIFSGMIGATIFAITTDLFPFQQRGRVIGILQTSFAASQVLGIPFGLYLSNRLGWHAPFLLIVIIAVLVGIVIVIKLKPINAHLHLRVDKSPIHHLKTTLSNPQYLLAFMATCLLSLGGFMLMPFSSAFTVHNMGIEMEKLPIIYIVTGVSAIFTGPLIGNACDLSENILYFFCAFLTILMVIIYTNLGVTPLVWVTIVNALLFFGIFSRMIPV